MEKSKILVELQESMGSDRKIAESAWTSSYNKYTRLQKTDTDVANIVERLIKEGHGTPIESVVFRFWIRMPIFADRQHMTHRLASHNGLSGRYRTMPDDFYKMTKDVKGIMERAEGQTFSDDYDVLCSQATGWYKNRIKGLKDAEITGVITNAEFKRAREILRGVLPMCGMVERTTIMNLRSFANYQYQRNSEHAQPEIREVAQLMLQEVIDAQTCPIAIKHLIENGWRI